MFWTSSSGRIELKITKAQSATCAHPGPCDSDVAALMLAPAIARQLAKIDATELALELREYGAWDAAELADHNANLSRVLWIACGDIYEGNI